MNTLNSSPAASYELHQRFFAGGKLTQPDTSDESVASDGDLPMLHQESHQGSEPEELEPEQPFGEQDQHFNVSKLSAINDLGFYNISQLAQIVTNDCSVLIVEVD